MVACVRRGARLDELEQWQRQARCAPEPRTRCHRARLLVTVNAEADRIAMHAVRRPLLESQAQRLGLPLHVIAIPSPCPNNIYKDGMDEALRGRLVKRSAPWCSETSFRGCSAVPRRAMRATGIAASLPALVPPDRRLAHEMVADGIPAVVTCVDRPNSRRRSPATFRQRFLDDLPADVDPAGSRATPHLRLGRADVRVPDAIRTGEVVTREGFVFCDVLPAGS